MEISYVSTQSPWNHTESVCFILFLILRVNSLGRKTNRTRPCYKLMIVRRIEFVAIELLSNTSYMYDLDGRPQVTGVPVLMLLKPSETKIETL